MMSKSALLKSYEFLKSHIVPYPLAMEFMAQRVLGVQNKIQAELIWFLEHPKLYTAGTSSKEEHLRHAKFPVYISKRGGSYTHHGPGQLIVYLVLDLKQRNLDPRSYVFNLEEIVIRTLLHFNITAQRVEGRRGIWVLNKKIAAIGVHISRWVTSHGIAINLNNDLNDFLGIIPCGIDDAGIISIQQILGFIPKSFFDTLQDVIIEVI